MKTIAGGAMDQVMPRVWPLQRSEDSVIRFDEGLIGFSEYKDFVLVESEEIKPFALLQCTTNAEVGFLVIDPAILWNDYYDLLPPRTCEMVGLDDPSTLMAFVICSIGATSRENTGNFLGPLIVNCQKMIGRQIILTDSRLSVRHSLL